MGAGILEDILKSMFDKGTALEEYTNLVDYHMVFNCISVFKGKTGVSVESLANAVFLFAAYIIMLKFIWKCFNQYHLAVDGDEDASPMILVINFVKAIAISMCFGILFDYLVGIAGDITSFLLAKMKFKNELNFVKAIASILTVQAVLPDLLILGVYAILAVILNVKFIKNAIELVILRVGISFAVAGVLDADGGVFKPYAKKFFQIVLAVIIQSACYKLSLAVLMNGHALWALAFMSMALTAPAFLQEFIMTNQGGGGKLQATIYSLSMLRSFRKV